MLDAYHPAYPPKGDRAGSDSGPRNRLQSPSCPVQQARRKRRGIVAERPVVDRAMNAGRATPARSSGTNLSMVARPISEFSRPVNTTEKPSQPDFSIRAFVPAFLLGTSSAARLLSCERAHRREQPTAARARRDPGMAFCPKGNTQPSEGGSLGGRDDDGRLLCPSSIGRESMARSC